MAAKLARFIDLFAGIGGFHVALASRGLACVFASENNAPAADAYYKNFGLRPAGDIREVAADAIPAHDVLCAGFPCQSFSRAGKRQGMADDRGTLFHEIARIAKHHRPALLLLENVPTILSIDGGEAKREIYARLGRLGYHLEHVVLNASHHGIPQQRQRAYFAAVRKDAGLVFDPPPATPPLTLGVLSI